MKVSGDASEGHRAVAVAIMLAGIGSLGVIDPAPLVAQQQLVDVPFPPQQQWVTDCRLPTVIHVGKQKITLIGGKFTNYGNIVVYATDGSCVTSKYPYSTVDVTFSDPLDQFDITAIHMGNFVQVFGAAYWSPAHLQYGSIGGAFYPEAHQWPFGNYFSPGKVAEVEFLNFTRPWAWGISSIKIPPSTPDVIQFDFASTSGGDDGKILLSTASWDTKVLSRYQVPGATPPQVKVSGTLLDGRTNQPKAGTAYLRLIDPPDTAPYRGSDAAAGDNEPGNPAVLIGGATAANGATKVQTDSLGHFEVTLSLASRTAGDNYQVEGSPDENFQCGAPGCAKSGVFTLWKRVYTEQTNMLRKSTFVRLCAQAGDSVIPVDDGSVFRNLNPGEPLVILHADALGGGYYADLNAFDGVTTSNGQPVLRLQSPLTHSFGCPGVNTTSLRGFSYLADAVGVMNAGVYAPNDLFTDALMSESFVDVQPTPDPSAALMPFRENVQLFEASQLAAHWFQHRDPVGGFQPNVIHRIAAASAALLPDANGLPRLQLGYTAHETTAYRWNFSYTFIGRIEQATTQLVPFRGQLYRNIVFNHPTAVVEAKTEIHETVHIWEATNGVDRAGHCNANRYQDSRACLMHLPLTQDDGSIGDGVVGLHYVNRGADSEYMDIRRAADPFK